MAAPLGMWGVLAAVVLLPWAVLAVDPGGFQPMGPVKFLAVGTVLVGAARALFRRGRLPGVGQLVPAPWVWAALLGWMAVTTATGEVWRWGLTGSPSRVMGLLGWLLFPVAVLVGIAVGRDRDLRRLFVRSLAVAGIVVSGYALIQVVGLDPVDIGGGAGSDRARSLLGNASFLAAHLTLVVPMAVGVLLADPAAGWRRVGGAGAVLGLAAAVASQSRGGLLGPAAGVLVLVAMPGMAPWRRHLRRPVVAVPIGVLLVGLAVAAAPRIAELDATGTVRGRAVLWSSSVELIADSPVLGHGPETFRLVAPATFSDADAREIGVETVADRAHQPVLDIGVGSGVPGMAAYLVLLVLLARALVAAVRTDPDPLVAGAAAAVVGYLVQLQVSISVAWLDVLMWVLVGVAVAGAGAVVASRPRGSAYHGPLAAWTALFVLVSGWGLSGVLADRSSAVTSEHLTAGRLDEAAAVGERAATWGLWRAEYEQVATRAALAPAVDGLEMGGRVEVHLARAERHATRAVELSGGDPAYLLDLGDVLAAVVLYTSDLDDARRVEAAFEAVVAAAPGDPRGWAGLAEVRRLLGDEAGAAESRARADALASE